MRFTIILLFPVSISPYKCGELETAIPGQNVPNKWPWIETSGDIFGIKLENKKFLTVKNVSTSAHSAIHPISILNPPGVFPFGFGNISIRNNDQISNSSPICIPKSHASFFNKECYRITKSKPHLRYAHKLNDINSVKLF